MDNLAYKTQDYNDIPDSPLLKKTLNQRTAGGVMIKAGKNKRLKLNISENPAASAKKHISRGTVLSVLLLTAMAFLVLFRGYMIQSGYDKLEAKNEELAAIVAENQKIQFKIDQTLDLENIEKVAKNTYNMGEPTKAQTVYINLDQTEEVKKVAGSNSFFGKIAGFFGSVVEYFS